jgi:hypothetical protein
VLTVLNFRFRLAESYILHSAARNALYLERLTTNPQCLEETEDVDLLYGVITRPHEGKGFRVKFYPSHIFCKIMQLEK